MLKWTRWTSGMTSSRIGEMWSPKLMWSLFWSFQNCFSPKLWLSSVESEPCVRPFPLRLSISSLPACVRSCPLSVLCWVVSCGCARRWEKAGRPLCSCLRAAWRGATPQPLSPVMHHMPHFTRSEALCLPCNSPGWSTGRYLPHVSVGGAGPERLWAVLCRNTVSGAEGLWPHSSSSCHWTLFPLVLQRFKDSLLILFVFQTFLLFILRQFFSVKKNNKKSGTLLCAFFSDSWFF